MKYFDIINEACINEGMSLNEEQYRKFIKYKDLIKEWNTKINLTAITEDDDIIKKHFIDCIKIFNFLPLKSCKNIIDVGTGAGFPGIPMKIINPNCEITLLDSLNKRINFLKQVINELELNNIFAIHGRAEDYAREAKYREGYDAAVSRAVANLTVLSEFCLPYVKVGGYFVAMKGPSVDEEILDAKSGISILGGKIEDRIRVNIESSDLNHNLIVIKKVKKTPNTYPRKAGTAVKKPLR